MLSEMVFTVYDGNFNFLIINLYCKFIKKTDFNE